MMADARYENYRGSVAHRPVGLDTLANAGNTHAMSSDPKAYFDAVAQAEPLECVAYVYDGTTEGLLTAVFKTYELHETPEDIMRQDALQLRLGQSARIIVTDDVLAQRVKAGVCKRAGREAWEAVLHASLSDEPSMGMMVWRFVRFVMAQPAERNHRLIRDSVHPIVGPVMKLGKSVMNERHLMQQFLRFEHFENDVWFARCNPKANVVPLLMDWFAGRFNTQRFVIYDEVHSVAGIYDGNSWYLAQTGEVHLPLHSEDEAVMQAAWKGFYNAMAISARYHPELQRHFMPKRFWRNILEVRDELSDDTDSQRLSGLSNTLQQQVQAGRLSSGNSGYSTQLCDMAADFFEDQHV